MNPININSLQQSATIAKVVQSSENVVSKEINQLVRGDTLNATIVDIQRNRLQLLLPTGEKLTAYAQALPEARIGEATSFVVREHTNGRLLLEMLKSGESKLANALAREALTAADMPVTDENIKLVKEMVSAKLPIDAFSLQRSAFFYYSGGEARTPLDKVLFLASESFPAEDKSLKTMDVLEGGVKLGKELELLGRELSQIKPEILQNQLSREINRLTKNSRVDLKPENAEGALRRFYAETKETVAEVISRLQSHGDEPSAQKTLERAEAIRDTIDFMENISRFRQYLQISFTINGKNGDGELYIFKETGGKPRPGQPVSALVALDNNALGRVEVLAVKTDKNVSLSFRAESDSVLRLVNQHWSRLKDALESYGLSVTGLQLKRLEGRFKLTDTIKSISQGDEQKKRYSFDMRV